MQVLTPMLLEDELHVVFGRVAALYGKNLAEAFSRLEPLVSGAGSACRTVPAVPSLL